MKNTKLRNSLLLVLTALIWGSSFVAQRQGGSIVGPFTFNCVRSIIGGIVLIPVIALIDKVKPSPRKPQNAGDRKILLIGGLCCGTMLFLASTMQQLGMFMGTTAGKSGFLTACYILIVPVLGIFFKKKCSWNIWIGIVITIGGLYLLCVKESLSLAASDLVTLLCALLFAGHIMVIDHFSPLVDGVRLSCIQFFACGIWGFFPMMFCEIIPDGMAALTSTFASSQAWIALLYSGVMSCGVAYTLQIIGQNGLNPTLASMIMSLESVFSVLTGWLILDEQLGGREIIGCVLIFAAILLAQVPVGKKIKA